MLVLACFVDTLEFACSAGTRFANSRRVQFRMVTPVELQLDQRQMEHMTAEEQRDYIQALYNEQVSSRYITLHSDITSTRSATSILVGVCRCLVCAMAQV